MDYAAYQVTSEHAPQQAETSHIEHFSQNLKRKFGVSQKGWQNSEQDEKSLKKRKMPLQAFEFPEYVIPSCCSFPLW